MKYVFLLLLTLFLCLDLSAQALDALPTIDQPQEFDKIHTYTRGFSAAFRLDTLRKYFAADIVEDVAVNPNVSIPDSLRGRYFISTLDSLYYVDYLGAFVNLTPGTGGGGGGGTWDGLTGIPDSIVYAAELDAAQQAAQDYADANDDVLTGAQVQAFEADAVALAAVVDSTLAAKNYSDAYTISDINNFASVPPGKKAVIVENELTGGTFIRDATATTVDGGIVPVVGWRRKFNGPVYVDWFGGDPTDSLDNTAAIRKAIAISDDVHFSPDGIYRLDSMVTLLNGVSIFIPSGTTVKRPDSIATTKPMFWLKGSQSEIRGAGASSILRSFGSTPDGIIRIGHESMVVDPDFDNTYCTVTGLGLYGKAPFGATSGLPDAAIKVVSNQVPTGNTSYFHNIKNLIIGHVNYGIWLQGTANANTIENVQFVRLGGNNFGVGSGAIFFDGAEENMVSNFFVHFSTEVTCLKFDKNANGDCELNSITNFVVEPGQAGTRKGIQVIDIGQGNFIQGIFNGTPHVFGTFYANKKNSLLDASSHTLGANLTVASASPTLTLDDTGAGGQLWKILSGAQRLIFRRSASSVDALNINTAGALYPGSTAQNQDIGLSTSKWRFGYFNRLFYGANQSSFTASSNIQPAGGAPVFGVGPGTLYMNELNGDLYTKASGTGASGWKRFLLNGDTGTDASIWASFNASTNVNMGSFKVTNLAAGTAATDAVNKSQLDAAQTAAQDYADANDAINDADADPANEIQTISRASNLVSLSNGGGAFSLADHWELVENGSSKDVKKLNGKVAIGTNTFRGSLNIGGNIGTDIGSPNYIVGASNATVHSTGNYISGIGFSNLDQATTIGFTSFLGSRNGRYLLTSNHNFFGGWENGPQSGGDRDASNAIIIGQNAAFNAASIDNVVALGYRAGFVSPHSDWIAIGRNASPSQSGDVVLGNSGVTTRLSVGSLKFKANTAYTSGQVPSWNGTELVPTTLASGADNLGNHTASTNLLMGSNAITWTSDFTNIAGASGTARFGASGAATTVYPTHVDFATQAGIPIAGNNILFAREVLSDGVYTDNLYKTRLWVRSNKDDIVQTTVDANKQLLTVEDVPLTFIKTKATEQVKTSGSTTDFAARLPQGSYEVTYHFRYKTNTAGGGILWFVNTNAQIDASEGGFARTDQFSTETAWTTGADAATPSTVTNTYVGITYTGVMEIDADTTVTVSTGPNGTGNLTLGANSYVKYVRIKKP